MDDLIINVGTDLFSAVFLVTLIEAFRERDRRRSNHARERAVARAVQQVFQACTSIISELTQAGATAVRSTAVPSIAAVAARRTELHGTAPERDPTFDDDPIPYCTFLVTHYAGDQPANVYPPRPTKLRLTELYLSIEPARRDALLFDAGFLPDEVVDAIHGVQTNGVVAACQYAEHIGRFGYWPEDDLRNLESRMAVMNRYFGPVLGLQIGDPREPFRDAATTAVVLAIRRAAEPA